MSGNAAELAKLTKTVEAEIEDLELARATLVAIVTAKRRNEPNPDAWTAAFMIADAALDAARDAGPVAEMRCRECSKILHIPVNPVTGEPFEAAPSAIDCGLEHVLHFAEGDLTVGELGDEPAFEPRQVVEVLHPFADKPCTACDGSKIDREVRGFTVRQRDCLECGATGSGVEQERRRAAERAREASPIGVTEHGDVVFPVKASASLEAAMREELQWIVSYLAHNDQDANHASMVRRIRAVLAGKDPRAVAAWTEHDGVRPPKNTIRVIASADVPEGRLVLASPSDLQRAVSETLRAFGFVSK